MPKTSMSRNGLKYIRVHVMPSGYGKTTLSKAQPDRFVDIDDLVPDLNSVQGKQLRRSALRTGNWDIVSRWNGTQIQPRLQDVGDHRVLLAHTDPRLNPLQYGDEFEFIVTFADTLTDDEVERRVRARGGDDVAVAIAHANNAEFRNEVSK